MKGVESMDFFSIKAEKERKKFAPLADRMRPESLDDVVGQEHIIGEGKPLRRLILADRIPSMIFFGPPGTGKTTLASVIAKTTNRFFAQISAVTGGVKEIREVISNAEDVLAYDDKHTILFIDEIHRFNKSQQDALLPHVENGTVTLIGATTENPFFEVNKALLSRSQVIELKSLSKYDLSKLIDRVLEDKNRGLGLEPIELTDKGRQALLMFADGDARVLLNSLEIATLSTKEIDGKIILNEEIIADSVQKKVIRYDKGDEEHYNTISAFIKSVRGSDPDAAIYYLARMLEGGEDPLFIARRLVILSSEDIGNAEPMALNLATSCYTACSNIGMPEARIILSQTTTYLASCPKSNAAYMAIDSALNFIRTHENPDIPDHLKDAHYSGAKDMNRGVEYKYPHNYTGGYVLQKYLPNAIMDECFYNPKEVGKEAEIKKYLNNLKHKNQKARGEKNAD